MRLGAVVVVILAAVLASPATAQVTSYSTSSYREVIATATVPDRNDAQLYLSVLTGTLTPGEMEAAAFSDRIYYQLSGSAEISYKWDRAVLRSGDGIFIGSGTKFGLKARDAAKSAAFLQFVLSSDPGVDRSGLGETPIEVYRSPSPVPALQRIRNLLTLSRVRVPPQSPCDSPHRRSGAALHYVLSGVGAEFTETRAINRPAGSVSYEPRGLVYQWSNPGPDPLVYLLFNVNPADEPPVLRAREHPSDPFGVNTHVTWAIYCVGISMILTLVVAAGIHGSPDDEMRTRKRWKR